MEAVVAIHFLPTGEVDQAYIHTSSGNTPFDRSAVQAVERVGRFPRVANVDPLLFERRLRTVLVKFRPEGLRW
jgi:colicin import membrane protein